jgi:hypothetical protein
MEGVNLDGKNDQCESVKDQCTSEIKARHNPGEIYFTLILLLINVAFLMESFKMEGIFQRSYNKGGFLPQTISIISIIMIVTIGIRCFKDGSKAVKFIEVFRYIFSRDVLIMITMVIVYALVLKHLRYKLSTFLFLFLSMISIDRYKLFNKIIISFCIMAASVLIFATVFKVLLP